MSDLFIRKFLDVSTGHLSIETRDWLGGLDWATEGPAGGPTYHGWFLYAAEDNCCVPHAPHAPVDEFPHDLWAAFELARAHCCDYVLFDCDGPRTAKLTWYEEDKDGTT